MSKGDGPGGRTARRSGGTIRLCAFDLDGTLLGPDRTLGPAVKRAVAGLKARGITVLIVTGRMHVTAQVYARELGLEGTPLASFNGAMVRRVGGPLPGEEDLWWYRPIATEAAGRVVAFLAERGLEPLVFDADRVYAAGPGPGADQYRLISGVDPVFVGDLGRFVAGDGGAAQAQPGDPARPAGPVHPAKLLQVHDPELMPALEAEAQARFGAELAVTTSYPFFLEFMDRGVSKGRALAEVCRRLGVAPAEVAAFGDGMNDLDMLEWAGLGVAMGHGAERLCAAADAVAEGLPGEGLARFIEENLLG